ncbi:MAG: hypothetical protein RLZ55_568 [Actinomycetota bacterium]
MSRRRTWDAADRLALQTARAVLNPDAAHEQFPVPDPDTMPELLASQGLLMHANPAWPLYGLTSSQQQRMAAHIKLLGIIALTRTRAVTAVAEALDAAGVRFLLIKGVALAQQVWGRRSARGAGDIDILVAESDLEATAAVLADLGAVPQRTDRDLRPRAKDRRMHHALTFHYADTDVDVHYRLDAIPTVFTVPFEEFYARSTDVTIGARNLRTLSPTDALLLVACHGGRDSWVKWGSVLDFVALWRSACDAGDGSVSRSDEVLARAATVGAGGRLGVALALGRVLDPTLPQQSPRATRIARHVVALHAAVPDDSIWVQRGRGWGQYRVKLASAGTREAYLWGARSFVWEGDLDKRPGYQGPGSSAVEVASKVASMASHAFGSGRLR